MSGLYKGFVITNLREFFLYGSYFAAYEMVKKQTENPSKIQLMIFGGLGGVSGWCAGFMLDNIKSRIQSDSFENPKYKTLPETLKQLSFKDMTKGFVPGFVRGFPVNAMTFLAYELAHKKLSQML